MDMKNLYALGKHKQLITGSVIALGILLSGFWLVHNEQGGDNAQALVAAHPVVLRAVSDIDTDRDGLADWKEKLYGSNMYAADTDGDGTNDGDEIQQGRNPVIRNTAGVGNSPNDKLPYLEAAHFATSSTDMVGLKKEFFARYLAEGSQNIKETTYRDLIKRVDAKTFAPEKDILNLTVSSDNSVGGIKSYINAFGTMINKYANQQMEHSEDMVIQNAMTKNDADTRAELQLFAIGYKNFSKDLLAIPVPSPLAKAHLLIVNGYAGMSTGLSAVGNMRSDPINGTAGYEAYMKYRLDVTNGYAMIVAYIADHQITFTATEPGYPFYWNTVAKQAPTQK
jgi:hypothetical protein